MIEGRYAILHGSDRRLHYFVRDRVDHNTGEVIVEVELVNCTPHAVTLEIGDKEVVIQPSGIVPRVEMDKKVVGKMPTQFGAITLIRSKAGIVKDLPPELSGVMYIVSALVAIHAPKHRRDLVIVDDLQKNGGAVMCARALAWVEEG